MTGFILATCFMVSLLVLPVLWIARGVFVASVKAGPEDLQASTKVRKKDNIEAFRQQMAMLDAQLGSNEIDPATHAQLASEAKQQLLQETQTKETQHQQTVKLKQLKRERAIVFIATLAVPLIGVMIYHPSGYSLGYLDQLLVVEKMKQIPDSENRQQAVQVVIETTERYTESFRADPQLLHLLASIYRSQGRYDEAMQNLERLLIAHENADTLAMMVELQYMQQVRQQQVNSTLDLPSEALFTPLMQQRLTRALELNPDHPDALSLSGILAFRSERYESAIKYWQKALTAYPPMSAETRTLRDSINAARQRGELSANNLEAATALIKLRVTIDEKQLNNDDPATPVFVFARPASGPRMPLAARRLTLADLPADVVLTNHDAMAGLSIADVEQVQVGARLARGGQPSASAGDLESGAPIAAVQKLSDLGIQSFDAATLATLERIDLRIDSLHE